MIKRLVVVALLVVLFGHVVPMRLRFEYGLESGLAFYLAAVVGFLLIEATCRILLRHVRRRRRHRPERSATTNREHDAGADAQQPQRVRRDNGPQSRHHHDTQRGTDDHRRRG